MQFTLSPNQRTKLVEIIDLTPEQEAFLSTTGKVVLKACPGSGKTYLVARKLTDLLKTWKQKDQGIATLSFTNQVSFVLAFPLIQKKPLWNSIWDHIMIHVSVNRRSPHGGFGGTCQSPG